MSVFPRDFKSMSIQEQINSIYKRLDKLERNQESMELIKYPSTLEMAKSLYGGTIEELKNENEMLRKKLHKYLSKGYCECEYSKNLRLENERLKKENEELNDRMAEVTYMATGGRLSYSNYTLDAIEQAFQDQLEILSDRKAEQEIEFYKRILKEIREIAVKKNYLSFDEALNDIVDKINEGLENE